MTELPSKTDVPEKRDVAPLEAPVASPTGPFEETEWTRLFADDSNTGRFLGQLLGLLFLLLLVLMIGTTIWTAMHRNIGPDPHATHAIPAAS